MIAVSMAPGSRAQAANWPVLQLDAWRRALLSGESAALAPLYTEAPQVFAPVQKPSSLKSEVDYWV